MPSTSAIFTGLTGLNANARTIDVVGNNIANVNTTAFKSSRTVFSTLLPRTINLGSPPGDTTGGTNPFQVGNGVRVSGIQRNFSVGASSATGNTGDMAIDGDGFFVVKNGDQELYTRAGAFQTNAQNVLTTIGGATLQGFGVNENFEVIPGTLTDLNIPLGELKLAEATQNVRFSGNLNAQGTLPTHGSLISLMGSTTSGFSAVAGAGVPAPDVLQATTRLIDIEDPQLPGSGTPLFAAGQSLQMRSAEKGGRTLSTALLDISTTSTVADLMTFFSDALGISTTAGNNPDGATPGLSLDTTTGIMAITGNTGTANDLTLDAADLRLLDSSGAVVRYPFVPAKSAAADGESVRTGLIVFDSLGSDVSMDMTMVLDGRDDTGTRWRYYVESPDDSDPSAAVATGTFSFDNDGQPVSSAPIPITIDRAGSGAATPLAINLDLSSADDGLTSLADDQSELSATFRDGASLGTLVNFGVGADGTITGVFTNGLTRTLGQVALATFTNPEGLDDAGNSLFRPAANSGTATITTPGDFGTGQITAGALELSNVDLGEEFIKMIVASTGYSASSRVIRTADELLQQLLVIGR